MKTTIDYEAARKLAPLGDAINAYALAAYKQTAKPAEDVCLQVATISGYAYLRFVSGSQPEPPLPAQRKQVGWYVECDVWVDRHWVAQSPSLCDDYDKEQLEERSKDNPTYRNVRIRPAWVEA